jgi:hypothetical protein
MMNLMAAYTSSRAAPDGDDEVHGHQHGFPEDEEQQEIERHEHAQHGGLQQQEEAVVFLEPFVDGVPARQDGDEADERGEHHQQQSEPVDAEVIGGAQGGNPGGLLDELKVLRAVEIEDQREGNQEAHERGRVGPQLDGARIRRGNEQQQQEADQGRKQDNGEDVVHRRLQNSSSC